MATKRSLFVINFITGASDGLVLPMAACLIALFIFNGDESWKAILAGIVVSVAGALAFGLARFYGEKEEIHHHHPGFAASESEKEAAMMRAIDIDPALSEDMLTQMEAEKELWLKEIKENDLNWDRYDRERAIESGLHTAGGFLAGGALVCLTFYLLCIFFLQSPWVALLFSLASCYGLGWYKGHLLGRNAVRYGMMQFGRALIVMIAIFLILLFQSANGRSPATFIFGAALQQP